MTKKVECPNCHSKHIKGEADMVVCEDCGFHSMSLYTDLSKDYKDKPKTTFDHIMRKHPILIQELKVIDPETDLWWFPLIMNLYPKGIVYPIGSEKQWKWAYAPYKVIPIEERDKYPIPDKPGEYYEYMLNIKKEMYYEKYFDALNQLKD